MKQQSRYFWLGSSKQNSPRWCNRPSLPAESLLRLYAAVRVRWRWQGPARCHPAYASARVGPPETLKGVRQVGGGDARASVAHVDKNSAQIVAVRSMFIDTGDQALLGSCFLTPA